MGTKGLHRIDYSDWGEEDNRDVVLCVHGLTRNGRDFDYLARSLATRYRVVCPDLPGRGTSEWLHGAACYTYPQYLADLTTLMMFLGAPAYHWVGTSLGGILGMMMAAQPVSPVRKLVLNDVGSRVPVDGLKRLYALHAEEGGPKASLDEVERSVRRLYAEFGPLTSEQWRHLAIHGARQCPDGLWRWMLDPEILSFTIREGWTGNEVDLGVFWKALHCPVLVMHGSRSRILPRAIVDEMKQYLTPRVRFREVMDCGHAPALMSREQIGMIEEFLGE